MKVRPTLIEAGAVAAFFLIGLLLRTRSLPHEAVEHFDEGVYSSTLWHDAAFNAPYPARDFYAPPLVPTLIELTALVPGLQNTAPFLPSIFFGTLSILALWWLARAWFGRAAGIFMAAVVAMSDFHVVYSRMALTDVVCLFWIVSSVGLGTLALQQRSYRNAAIGGVLCGLAWWTKYTGWLPLAIVLSGSSIWWIWVGRRTMRLTQLLGLLTTMAAMALLTFSPWWWHLQSVGGYAAVSANHAGYMGGIAAWSKNLATHLTIQFWMDGMFGAISLGLGMVAAGGYRWFAAECSTWNTQVTGSGSADSSAAARSSTIATSLLFRFLAAGVALTVISLRIWTPLMLTCIALGGFGGIFLWPVLQRIQLRRTTGDLSPTTPDSLPLTRSDLDSAALIDPALGYCTTAAWFLGMLLTTPMYHPYSRLFFPLMAAIWMAAAGGISWWLESNVSVSRRMAASGEVAVRKSWAQHLVTGMLVAAVGSSFIRLDENEGLVFLSSDEILRPSTSQDRTSIIAAANELADISVLSARGEFDRQSSLVVPIGENISPAAILKKALEEAPERPELSDDERRKSKLVVYVFGEPALCLHLARAGITVAPVSHLNLGEPDGSSPSVPTFLVIGPNAKRTPGFWEMWLSHATLFDSVSDVQYLPSNVTLLDLFSPQWLSQHDESLQQTFELHRVK